jgi:hypothetical protein
MGSTIHNIRSYLTSGCAWVCGDVYESQADASACFFQQHERACLRYTRAFEDLTATGVRGCSWRG